MSTPPKRPTVALTGSTGFLGSRLLDRLLAHGFLVKALVRREQPAKNGVTFILGDLTNKAALQELVEGSTYVIHGAGLTKALTREDYFAVNDMGTERLLTAANASQSIKRFIQVSSLAAREPALSHYGASKAAADKRVIHGGWHFERLSMRPPAVYGPGDMELLKALKLARGSYGVRLYPSPSGLKSRAGFIHVDDLSNALIAALEAPLDAKIVEVDDGKVGGYLPHEIASAMTVDLDKSPRVIALPFVIRALVGSFADALAMVSEKPSKVMSEQLDYLSHPDWSVSEDDRWRFKGWVPDYGLKEGMGQTIKWYRENGHL